MQLSGITFANAWPKCVRLRASLYLLFGMTPPRSPDKIDAVESGSELPFALALPQRQKVVLVMDLVESVRLMAANELAVIDHWRGFVHDATSTVLPAHGGRLVKSLGDGIMAEFDSAREAAAASLALHHHFDAANAALPLDQMLYLRAGLNATHVYVDDLDIYGSGVNLAARVASLAGPGETMVTVEVRDQLVDGLDAHLEDMGECYLKHVAQPVRTYRLGSAGSQPIVLPRLDYATSWRPTVAVVPFASRNKDAGYFAVGDVVADGVISQLSRTAGLNVVSRLSTLAFREREADGALYKVHLDADYVVTGSYVVSGEAILLTAVLTDTGQNQIIWTDRFSGEWADLLEANSSLCQHIAEATLRAVLDVSAQQALTRPMPTLASQTLMLGSINLMHRSAHNDFLVSRKALEALVERHPRAAICRAWLAKWYVLNCTRGLATDTLRDAQEALGHTARALDAEPSNSLALAMEGFVYLHLRKDLATALARLESATTVNPNDSLAWLFLSVAQSFRGECPDALSSSERALALSPLDPLRYYYESLAASSALSAHQYERARVLCENSRRLNRTHASTLRALIAAHIGLGNEQEARVVASDLLRLVPTFTVNGYLGQSASASHPFGQQIAQALQTAGIPVQ